MKYLEKLRKLLLENKENYLYKKVTIKDTAPKHYPKESEIEEIETLAKVEGMIPYLKSIKIIEDYFKSRTCNNCINYHQGYLCLEIGDGYFKPTKDFSCNKWEDKK